MKDAIFTIPSPLPQTTSPTIRTLTSTYAEESICLTLCSSHSLSSFLLFQITLNYNEDAILTSPPHFPNSPSLLLIPAPTSFPADSPPHPPASSSINLAEAAYYADSSFPLKERKNSRPPAGLRRRGHFTWHHTLFVPIAGT